VAQWSSVLCLSVIPLVLFTHLVNRICGKVLCKNIGPSAVERSEAWRRKMSSCSCSPLTVIGGEEVVVGFDRKKLERLLGL
jgi:hypothetical protein